MVLILDGNLEIGGIRLDREQSQTFIFLHEKTYLACVYHCV